MFLIAYKETRQLTNVDEFLERLENDFVEKEWPKIESVHGVIMTALPLKGYTERFDGLMSILCEQNKRK